MIPTQQPCGTAEELLHFLRGQMEPQNDSAFQEHLDGCASCRKRLEEAAGDADSWNAVRRFLVTEALTDHGENQDEVAGGLDGPPPIDQVVDALGPTDDPESLGRLGSYEVTGVVGAGGMGVVLKAQDRSLDRIVAIKVMAPHLASNGSARKRFAREAKAAAAVIHPNVIAIHGVSTQGALPYLVMPFAGGTSLQGRLDKDGPLEPIEVLRVGSQIAAGLAAAHGQGLVHRDIKPANILLDQGVERVAITDFGLARAVDDASMTRSGMIAGTPQYMSPEQARGESIDNRSDLFSLGGVLYAMCTGRAPFRAETSYGVLRRITDAEPKAILDINSAIPDWLCGIIAKLMRKRPEERFASAGEVARLLEGCLAHLQQPMAMPLPPEVLGILGPEEPKPVVEEVQPRPKKSGFFKLPPPVKNLVLAFFAFFLVAGGYWLWEQGEGKLTIESDADDVPIRITRGDQVVERMKVMKTGSAIRIAAGKYLVELDGKTDDLIVENNQVTLRRGANERVKITYTQPPRKTEAGLAKLNFETPEALMAHVAACQDRGDTAGYLACLTEEPVKRLAVMYLRNSIRMLEEFEKNPGGNQLSGHAEQMKKLDQIIREEIMVRDMTPSEMMEAQLKSNPVEGNRGNKLDLARSVPKIPGPPRAVVRIEQLENTRRFVARYEMEFPSKAGKEHSYTVERKGDRAVAKSSRNFFTPETSGTYGLIKTEQGWRIQDPWVNDPKEWLEGTQRAQGSPPTDEWLEEWNRSLEFATRNYNRLTAELRRELFNPPIPDLTLAQMREGFAKAAAAYRKDGREHIAVVLQKIADTDQLPEGAGRRLVVAGVDDKWSGVRDGGDREIAPGLMLPDSTKQGGLAFVTIKPLALVARKNGKSTKTYGEEYRPDGPWPGTGWRNAGAEGKAGVAKPFPGEIVGYLKDEAGRGIQNATVACSAVPDGTLQGGGANAITDADGCYRLKNLAPGIYNVWLKNYPDPGFTALADEGVTVGESGKAKVSQLKLVKTVHVTGVVHVAGSDKPVPEGIRVECHCPSRPVSSSTELSAITDGQGRFSFDLPPGRANFHAVSSVVLTDKEEKNREMELRGRVVATVVDLQGAGGKPFEEIRLVLKPDPWSFGSTEWLDQSTPGTEVLGQRTGADITGTVLDAGGKPVEGAKIFAEAGGATTSDGQGQFVFRLAKGTQVILRGHKAGYQVWFGMPTAGDKLKIVMERKATDQAIGNPAPEGVYYNPKPLQPKRPKPVSPPGEGSNTKPTGAVGQVLRPRVADSHLEIADLDPRHDKQEVTLGFTVEGVYEISGSVPVGSVPSFSIRPRLKPDGPQLNVLASGELADCLRRLGYGPDSKRAKGVCMQATGTIRVLATKDAPGKGPAYQFNIQDWNKFSVIPNPQGELSDA